MVNEDKDFPQWATRWGIVLLAGIFLLGLGSASWILVSGLANTGTPAPSGVRSWSTLPQPRVVRPNWTSHASAASVRDVLSFNGWLWLATDGGLVIHDPAAGENSHWRVEHGLPGNRLRAVAADQQGFVWVGGAAGGVARFDGAAWQIFTEADGLPADEILALAADDAGAVWATTSEGLARFDGRRWSAVRFSLVDFSPPAVRDLSAAPGGIWAATDAGVWWFDGRRWTAYTVADGLISDDVRLVSASRDGRTVWAASPAGLSRYRAGRWERFSVRSGLRESPAAALSAAADGSVWLTYAPPFDDELIRFDGGRPLQAAPPGETTPIQALAAGVGDDLWLGTAAGLSGRLGGSWTEIPLPDELPGRITDLLAAENEIWAAGDRGLARWNGRSWERMSEAAVGALAVDPAGRLLTAGSTPADGLNVYEAGVWRPQPCATAGPPLKFIFDGAIAPDGAPWFLAEEGAAVYRAGSWRLYANGWPADAEPRAIAVGRDGTVWASLAQGLYRLDAAAGRWRLAHPAEAYRLAAGPNGDVWLLGPQGVGHFLVDEGEMNWLQRPPLNRPTYGFVANEQGVWLSGESGVARLTGDGWRLYSLADGLAAREVTTLALDGQGRVWAGYGDSRLGFSVFDDRRQRWEIVHNVAVEDAPNGGHAGSAVPRRDEVLEIGVTSEGRIWYGSYFGDVGSVAPEQLLYRPDDYRLYWRSVRAILVDRTSPAESVWIADNEGRIARFWPGEARWERYDKRLATAEVRAVVAAGAGIWLGTDLGVVEFDGERCAFLPWRDDIDVLDGIADPLGGTVWWLTGNAGVLQLDEGGDGLRYPALALRGRPISAAAAGRSGLLWFAERERLLPLEEGAAGAAIPAPLAGEPITALAIGVDLRPWVGTAAGVYLPAGREWLHFDVADGLPDPQIVDILPLPDGSVWIATAGGIGVYRP